MVEVANNDAAMNAALKRGQATLPQFVTALKNPRSTQSNFAVYARFSNGKNNEYLWLEPVQISGTRFQGRINNTPELLTHLKLGQTVNIAAKDVGDWMFIEKGKLVGGQTSRVLRNQMNDKERVGFDASLPYKFN